LAKGADQGPITALIEEWKAGRALPPDATVEQIRAAVVEVLADPTFREEAARRARSLVDLDGAQLAADSVESVIASGG
jgi:UDP:flavonoid glycosyltransferase YjiC (YdhE family)